MSCIRLNLTDHNQTRSGDVHASIGDAVIAALSAEPETIQELELALARFVKPSADWSTLAPLHAGEDFEPDDAGIVIVDLAAHVVMIDSTCSAPGPIADAPADDVVEGLAFVTEQEEFWAGLDPDSEDAEEEDPFATRKTPPVYGIYYHDGEKRTAVQLPYRLPDDWLFVGSVPEYKEVRPERRSEKENLQPFDARQILFGRELCQFIAGEILAAPDLEAEDLYTEIHATWLMTRREDLHGATPRELLQSQRDFIDFDLHSREFQWSFVEECPPPLLHTAHAYRFGGFGTHEIVLYYDLIRLLLNECYKRAREEQHISVAEETERLEQIKNTWLEAPNSDHHGKAPAMIIEWERRRIPLVMSGKEAIIDEDCPVCQAAAEDLETPMFWHLDGCNMDNRFEFSFFATREEWEADKRRQEKSNEEFDRQWQARETRMIEEGRALTVEEGDPF